MSDETSLVLHALVALGVCALAWTIVILRQGEFSARGNTTTRCDNPFALFLTVLIIALTGVGLLLVGSGRIR